jgi:CheY-like chemotaxis protein
MSHGRGCHTGAINMQRYGVLIVDDSDDDRFFLRNVVDRLPRFSVAGEVRDGDEAIAYLTGQGGFGDRAKHPVPDLMLLDLKMPRKTGFEVLRWLRVQSFPNLTVVVLSGSPLQEDVGASLALGAHGYWTKTADLPRQNLIAQEIEALLDKRRSLLSAVGNV